MTPPRALFWIGPGAEDAELVRRIVAAGRGQILDPERTEQLVGREDLRGGPALDQSIRGFVVRDMRLTGPAARRNLRTLLGADGFTVQIVREPISALNRELRRQQAIAIARRWTSPGNAGSTELQVTDRMTAERVLPRLAYDRRGRAFTTSRGRRLLVDREEIALPQAQRLLKPIDEWLAGLDAHVDWTAIPAPPNGDGTPVLCQVARGPIEIEGASLHVELVPSADTAYRDDRIALARVPSIANRVGFPIEHTPLLLVVQSHRLERIPRGLRHALTETNVVQHLLEETLLPKWIERTDQVLRELTRQPQVSPALSMRIRRALRDDIERTFELRPTLRGRWGLTVDFANAV